MPSYAILDAGGVVTNIAEADASWSPGPGLTKRAATTETQMGGRWTGSAWEPAPAVTPLPPPITARQLRLWLLSRGISGAMVAAALATLPEPEQEAAEIEWEYSTQYLRDHPLIDQIGAAFDLTPEQIDAAWPEAAAL